MVEPALEEATVLTWNPEIGGSSVKDHLEVLATNLDRAIELGILEIADGHTARVIKWGWICEARDLVRHTLGEILERHCLCDWHADDVSGAYSEQSCKKESRHSWF